MDEARHVEDVGRVRRAEHGQARLMSAGRQRIDDGGHARQTRYLRLR